MAILADAALRRIGCGPEWVAEQVGAPEVAMVATAYQLRCGVSAGAAEGGIRRVCACGLHVLRHLDAAGSREPPKPVSTIRNCETQLCVKVA